MDAQNVLWLVTLDAWSTHCSARTKAKDGANSEATL